MVILFPKYITEGKPPASILSYNII